MTVKEVSDISGVSIRALHQSGADHRYVWTRFTGNTRKSFYLYCRRYGGNHLFRLPGICHRLSWHFPSIRSGYVLWSWCRHHDGQCHSCVGRNLPDYGRTDFCSGQCQRNYFWHRRYLHGNLYRTAVMQLAVRKAGACSRTLRQTKGGIINEIY